MRRIFACVLVAFAPVAAAAQGVLGSQGFGYPTGQYGGRAAGTAGALAPFDAVSAVNPAALADWRASVLFFHLEPEYRSTHANSRDVNTTEARFPLIGGAERLTSHLAVGVTFSTYLDRTWQTAALATHPIGADTTQVTTRYTSNGAINDLRLAAAWTFTPRFRLGVGAHVYTGENRLTIGWEFPDTTPYGNVLQSSQLSYTGNAASIGAEWDVVKHATIAAYARRGGTMRMRLGDTLLSKSDAPNHTGAAIRYDGLAGTVIAAGWERVTWSALTDLSTKGLVVHDADRVTLGLESRGPVIGRTPVYLRLGVASRGLPFEADGAQVHETIISGGAGYALAQDHLNLDFGLQHASRTAGSLRERAWLVTLGFAITP